MKVAIDTSTFYYSLRGVSRYIRCLLDAIEATKAPDLEITEIAYRIPNLEYRQPLRAMKTFGRECVWGPLVVPALLRRERADLLHAPGDVCIRSAPKIPKVATLHDLEPFYTPNRFRWWTRRRFPLAIKAYRETSRIICVSQSTADDAIKFLNYPARQIDVIHLGSQFNRDSMEQAPASPLPDAYFLFVSALEPGKNLRLLNEAYRLAESQGLALPPLLIAGERVEGVANEGIPPANWKYLGRIPDAELVYLYRRSLALLAPTRYEGFGLPVLEAMSLGTAVVCSKVSSLPEVGGEVPFYADQTPSSYLEQMRRIIAEPELRQARIEAGFQRAARFSWRRCAEQTIDVYRDMASKV